MNEMISRRTFLKVAGLGTVSIAAFGLTGCGSSGSGSSSPTEKVYTIMTESELNKIKTIVNGQKDPSKWTAEQKKQVAQIIPCCNDVYFPLVDVGDTPDDNKGTGLSMVTVAFEVINDSAQPIKFERSVQDFQIAFRTLAGKVHDADSLKDAIAEAKENYGSKQFASDDAQFITSYGILFGNSDTATAIPPKQGDTTQGGVIIAVMLVKQGWTKLNVSFAPNFASGETFRFEVSRNDITTDDDDDNDFGGGAGGSSGKPKAKLA